MEKIPQPNEIYQHFKGNLYRVVTLAKHADTGERMVIYQALYGDFEIWARPLREFTGRVDERKHPEAAGRQRFTLLPQIMGQDGLKPPAGEKPEQSPLAAGKPEQSVPAGEKPEQAAPAAGRDLSAAGAEEASGPAAPPSEEEPALDPMLMAFLDADSYEEKLAIFTDMRGRVTDDMLTTMAVALDIDLKEGELMERYEELKNCIVMLEKYECTRLR
ncbi:MAG TPA: DUF1653 domain-containing protein [Candidatus Eisenbergiella pullistercoris]|uniref:DUF1653 domain-containing protein n=1 Tax=Candidatus Eisenbergiella pullistercoris TaxID=2838555 RepID=A0A9D1YST7_9FIRM|nr:DUF1653 domain-containing protein [Candidatus Eisenbergiella pullistercoris]